MTPQDYKDIMQVIMLVPLLSVLVVAYIGRRRDDRAKAPLILLYLIFRFYGLLIIGGRILDFPDAFLALLKEALFSVEAMANVTLAAIFANGYLYKGWLLLCEGGRQLWLRLTYRNC